MFLKPAMKSLFFSLSLLGLSCALVEADARVYIVKKGDTLSGIVNELLPGDVWGARGNLQKVLALNPEITNPEVIFPKQKIAIDDEKPVMADESESSQDSKTLERTLAQVSEKTNFNESTFQPGTHFEFTPYYRFLTLSSVDKTSRASAKISSSYNFGVNFQYTQNWTEDFQTYFHLDLGAIGFEAPTSGTVTLSNTSKLLTAGGVGASRKLTASTRLGVFADYEKLLVLRSANAGSITVDAISSPELGANFKWDFLKIEPMLLGLQLQAAVDLPASTDTYSTQTGVTYGAKLYFSEIATRTHANHFESALGFYRRSQNTTITEQTETDVVFTFSVFFGEPKPYEGKE